MEKHYPAARALFEITPEIEHLAELCEKNTAIDKELYTKYEVKRGLRDLNGKGVLAGLTNISDIIAKKVVDGQEVPCEGELYYRGYNIKELVKGFLDADHYGFEEITYLLLFGELPSEKELKKFHDTLVERRTLPPNFVRDVIMKAPSRDMMNSLSRSILNMYSYDAKADDTSIPNVLRQCLNLISQFPMMMVYGYHAYNYRMGEDLFIYAPKPELSTAENILMMLREDRQYTKLEAKILDMALVLHMDHGGGNNSTFTTHVVTSSGTDTYSTIAAAMASLKGPKHGGANIKVTQMFEDMKKNVHDWEDKDEVRQYLCDLLDKKAFDQKGLIYGMGHAVYSISDPRAKILKSFIKPLLLAGRRGRRNSGTHATRSGAGTPLPLKEYIMTSAADVLQMVKDNDAKWIDLRFTDLIGKEMHLTIPAKTECRWCLSIRRVYTRPEISWAQQ